MGNDDKFIIIASESSIILGDIVKSLRGLAKYNCITVTRISDIPEMLKSIRPVLIILHCNNYNLEINRIHYKLNNLAPILCLTKKHEKLEIDLKDRIPLFSFSFENAISNKSLALNVKSILELSDISKNRKALNKDSSILKRYENSDKNLARYILELDQKSRLLEKVKLRVKELCLDTDNDTKRQLITILNTIKISTNANRNWEDFKIYFEKINPRFLNQLSMMFPVLTAKDLKYCCYLKMNMSNEDITHLLGINPESVRTHKYRLKKKMVLPKQQNLRNFICSFSNS
ncbi:MAG: hypothetical protein ABJK28_14170 [Algibacter sp.]